MCLCTACNSLLRAKLSQFKLLATRCTHALSTATERNIRQVKIIMIARHCRQAASFTHTHTPTLTQQPHASSNAIWLGASFYSICNVACARIHCFVCVRLPIPLLLTISCLLCYLLHNLLVGYSYARLAQLVCQFCRSSHLATGCTSAKCRCLAK